MEEKKDLFFFTDPAFMMMERTNSDKIKSVLSLQLVSGQSQAEWVACGKVGFVSSFSVIHCIQVF